jgi:hypothetical protein
MYSGKIAVPPGGGGIRKCQELERKKIQHTTDKNYILMW